MNTNKLFELYSTYGWPVVRHLVKRGKRCTRCILPEKHGPLKDGLCAECRAYGSGPGQSSADVPAASAELKSRFDQVVQSYVGTGRYDVLLLLSGGKDSAYILHRLRTEYPALKILCATVDNGFMSPVAIPNAELVAQKTHTDLLVIHKHVDEFARALRQAFLDLKGKGSYGVVDYADGSLIFEVGQKTAAALGIPVVVGGLSWVQVQRILGKDDFVTKDASGMTQLYPLFVWRTHEQEIRDYVRKHELMLPGSDSPVVSNSQLILAMSVIDVLTLGYSSFEPEFAQLIREGKTDRKTWLHTFELLEFATRKRVLHRDLHKSLEKLQLKLEDVIPQEKR